MMILGIDPSLTGTGLVKLDERGHIVCTRVLRSDKAGIERVIDIERDLADELDGVEVAAIEGYAFGAQASREALAELSGVLKRRLHLSGVMWVIAPPASVKKFATGRGNAKKDEMRLAVYKKWGLDEKALKTADEVDAYVLARIALAVAKRCTGRTQGLLKYEQDALKWVKRGA